MKRWSIFVNEGEKHLPKNDHKEQENRKKVQLMKVSGFRSLPHCFVQEYLLFRAGVLTVPCRSTAKQGCGRRLRRMHSDRP